MAKGGFIFPAIAQAQQCLEYVLDIANNSGA